MNRSLNIRSQLAAVAYNQQGRASIPTLDVSFDGGEDTAVECSCRHGAHTHHVTHEVLVSRDWS
jgi:hypothetical protein